MHVVNRISCVGVIALAEGNWLKIYLFLPGLARVKEIAHPVRQWSVITTGGARQKKSAVLPFEANTDFFASFFSGQNRQGRRAFGQRALTRIKIVTVAVIVAANLAAIEKLAGGFQISFFMRALSGKGEIFSLDERQEHLASAEVDFFHATGR
jgi:hypothetical protein